MVKFNASGSVLATEGGGLYNPYYPQIATADGGLIATNGNTGIPATFNPNLSLTGQMASLPIQSWLGNAYHQMGSIDQLFLPAIDTADNFWDVVGGNPSPNSSADPNIHVRLSVFNLYKNTPGDIQSDSTVTTKVNNTQSFWSTVTNSFMRTPPGCCCSHAPALLRTRRPCR